MHRPAPTPRSESELSRANQSFYEQLWSDTKLIEPARFNTWPLVSSLLSAGPRRLEIAPGLRPRLPIEGTNFVDISGAALAKLAERGGRVTRGSILALPYPDASFDLVAALDIVEHVDADELALAEITRVAAAGAVVLIATPLHPALWNSFDTFVGHCRRYEPADFLAKLARHGLAVEQSAAYGMQPKSSRLLDVGIWFLTHRRRKAMWCYNHLFMPLGIRFEKKLELVPGVIATDHVDEILLVCRKTR